MTGSRNARIAYAGKKKHQRNGENGSNHENCVGTSASDRNIRLQSGRVVDN